METLELSTLKVSELNNNEMRKTDGGLILFAVVTHHLAIEAGEAIAEAYKGAYEAGHDSGERNCNCS